MWIQVIISAALLLSSVITYEVYAMGGGPVRGDKLPKLISFVENSQRGMITSYNNEIISLFKTIESDNENSRLSKRLVLVDGKWELLWTTEKETLFFLKYGLFGKPVSNIYQDINIDEKTINNQILFEGDREFSVLGDINIDIDRSTRINFTFQKALLRIPPLPQLSLPPVGKGWFENVYVNEKYRLSRDVRGDYLLSQRVR